MIDERFHMQESSGLALKCAERIRQEKRTLTFKVRPQQKRVKSRASMMINSFSQAILGKTQKTADTLSKAHRPKIPYDKEKLYQASLELKQQNNELSNEINKLKTKILALQEGFDKKDETSEEHSNLAGNIHMINSLKQVIKSLQREIGGKENEINALKRNIKNSKVAEIEAEMKAYADECVRLKCFLQEALKDKTHEQVHDAEAEKNVGLLVQIDELRKRVKHLEEDLVVVRDENEDLRRKVREKGRTSIIRKQSTIGRPELRFDKAFQELEERERLNQIKISGLQQMIQQNENEISEAKNIIKEFQAIVETLHSEIKCLQRKLQESSKNKDKSPEATVRKSDPPKLLAIIHDIVQSKNILISILLTLLDKNNIGLVETDEFIFRLKGYNEKLRRRYVESVFDRIGVRANMISLSKLEVFYNEFEYTKSDISESDTENVQKTSNELNSENLIKDTAEFNLRLNKNSCIENEVDKNAGRNISKYYSFGLEIKTANRFGVVEKFAGEAADPIENCSKEAQEIINGKTEDVLFEIEDELGEIIEPKITSRFQASLRANDSSIETSSLHMQNPEVSSVVVENHSENPLNYQLSKLLQHISYRLQLERLQKSDIASLFPVTLDPNTEISYSTLALFLSSPPINILSVPDQEILVKYLLSDVKSSAVVDKLLNSLEEWEIFTEQKEAALDQQIIAMVQDKYYEIIESCENILMTETEITPIAFFVIFSELGYELDESLKKYMILLFYSFEMQLDVVPFRQFLDAYHSRTPEPTEEHRAEIVRTCLHSISTLLMQQNLTTKAVFDFDSRGLICPQAFYKGLKNLGLHDVSAKDINIFIEAIQFEGSNEVYVSIDELDQILEHYGITPKG